MSEQEEIIFTTLSSNNSVIRGRQILDRITNLSIEEVGPSGSDAFTCALTCAKAMVRELGGNAVCEFLTKTAAHGDAFLCSLTGVILKLAPADSERP